MKYIGLYCLSIALLGQIATCSPILFGAPSGPGKYSAHDVNAFLSQVPDEFIELARQAFPGLTNVEIVTLLLDGDDADMENLASSTAADGHVYTPTGGSLSKQRDGKKCPPLPFRNAVPYLAKDGGKRRVELAQDESSISSKGLGKDVQSPVGSKLALEAAPAPPESEQDLLIHIQDSPQVSEWSLAAELAAMSPEDIQAVQEVMASLGLPDITTGSLPTDFDPSSFPPEIAEIAKMLARQLEPENGGQQPPVSPIQLIPAKVKAVPAAAGKDDAPEEVPTLTATLTPKLPHRTQAQTQTQTVFPIPPDLRSLIPPRPRGQIPSYPGNQLPTPHNPVYSYDVSLLRHIDPYLFLDPTHPANPLTKTQLARISRFPELPDARARQDLNTPKCASVTHSTEMQNAKFTDCSRAISNIVAPNKNSPQSHPDFYSYTSTSHPPPTLSSNVVSEFGTCRVLARNMNGKAATAELDKVKYLAGRVLRECSEQQGGSWRDRRTRTAGGTVGYLFVNEDIGGWDVVEVVLERAVY